MKSVVVFALVKLLLLIIPPKIIKPLDYKTLVCLHILAVTVYELILGNLFNAILPIFVCYLLVTENPIFWDVYFAWNVWFSMQLLKNAKLGLFLGVLHNLPAYLYAKTAGNSPVSVKRWAVLREQALIAFIVFLVTQSHLISSRRPVL